ncbi:MAG: 5-formyltetrahydrofolate cyclo-ligase [Nanoarchaeota archaeon]|nr:5-formyltetrahydrofolate cyclo-ligase [Nanoarchaeota archaeon]
MKTIIRKEVLAKRNGLCDEHVSISSAVIKDSLFRHADFIDAQFVMFYVSKGKEVATHAMIASALAIGKRVCVPVMRDKLIIAAEISSFNDIGSKDSFGVQVPSEVKEVEKSAIDLVVVPLVAYDSSNNRIGYGLGAYDRFLCDYRGKKLGLAYGMQRVERIEVDDRDIPLDYVITTES